MNPLLPSSPEPVFAQPVRQGAILGGWLCFVLGLGVMYASLWAFWFYVPLLLVAFILSIAAMAQRRVIGGVLLLLATLALPPVQWFVLAARRTDSFVRRHLAPEQLATYEAGKAVGHELGREITRNDDPPAAVPTEVRAPAPPAVVETLPAAFSRRVAQAISTDEAGRPVVELTGDTVPLIFETRHPRPVPREVISEYIVGFAWSRLDEFARHDFTEHLGSELKRWEEPAHAGSLYRVTQTMPLGEYDFAKQAFPIRVSAELIEVLEPQPHLVPKYRYIEVPRRDIGGPASLIAAYRVGLVNRHVDLLPVPLDRAKALAPSLRTSGRQAEVAFLGRLARCEEITGHRVLYLDVSEITLTLPQSGERFTCAVPTGSSQDESAPPIASPPTVAKPTQPEPAPAPAPMPPASPAVTAVVPVLRPEAVVADVFDSDARLTVRNFSKSYAGQRVRFSETVVRKNPREELLVFKGGGFLTTAYDVQARLADDQASRFAEVNVGARITIEGTLDRLVPPALGLGSHSLRLIDARLISPSGEAPAAGEAEGWVVVNVPEGDALNVRATPAMNSDAVFALQNGQAVERRGQSVMNGETEWVPIRADGQDGWVRGKYLGRARR